MKKIPKKLPGSALLISLLILTGIFVIAFGAGFLSFFNTKNTDVYQQSTKARLAAETGVERIKWEVERNNFDMFSNCSSRMFETKLDDGSYYLKCSLDASGKPKIQAIGTYKNLSVTLDSGYCYDINTECTSDCAVGSLCGGGVLFSVSPRMIASPSGCTSNDGTGCDNSFVAEDSLKMAWDSVETSVQTDATSTDGSVNTALLIAAGAGRYTAAEFCDRLTVNGFDDWYLPSLAESHSMFLSGPYCNSTDLYCQHGSSDSPLVGGLTQADYYQTSNENIADVSQNWLLNFYSDIQEANGKLKDFYIRCLRRP